MQNGLCESYNGRRRDALLNETLFLSLAHACVEISAWIEDCNRERLHWALGYRAQAAFAAELNKQWPRSLRPTGSAPQSLASTVQMRRTTARHPSWRQAGRHVTIKQASWSSSTSFCRPYVRTAEESGDDRSGEICQNSADTLISLTSASNQGSNIGLLIS